MNRQETIAALALSRIGYLGQAGINELYRRAGTALTVVEHRHDIRQLLPDASARLVEAFSSMDELLRLAERELEQDEAMGIEPLAMGDDRYPSRLRECPDAPLVIFYRGSANLNQRRVVSIVGTRHCTRYGQDLVHRFMADLRGLCPQVLVVSGLAYGIDICAHREALEQGYETVGVLAHGLDEIYPPRHRQTAEEMVRQGGLLTEYTLHAHIDKSNFVRRNRIVAGMADATILVESAAHGGGLITTRIASDYNRDVLAFPGAVGAVSSEGCNQLIRDHGAQLITSASDFVQAVGWQGDAELRQAHAQGIERQLFPELTEEEGRVVAALRQTNDKQLGMLSVQCGIGIGRLSAIVFSLEMKGVVKNLAGGVCHLLY